MNLVDELHAVCTALVQAGLRHAVCGGVAVTVHGATRSKKDIDVLIAPEDLASLQGFLDGCVKVDLPEGPIVVVSRDVLIRMKRQAGRTQDLADLEKLEQDGG